MNSQTSSHQETPSAITFDEEKLFWGMRNVSADQVGKHFLLCGATGTGKTILTQLFLQSIAPRFQKERNHPEQLIVMDSRSTMIPLLAAMGLKPEDENVWILNPFDERGASFDLSDAVRSWDQARLLSELLIPNDEQNRSPFFTHTSRDVVDNVILGLNQIREGEWNLRDLICALSSKENIEALCVRSPKPNPTTSLDENTWPSVLSVLFSRISPLEKVAANWHNQERPRKFSIAQFLSKPGVLILGSDPKSSEALSTLNDIVLALLTRQILSQSDSSVPRHWFIFDELHMIRQMESLQTLMSIGRSKGVTVQIGIQSIEGCQNLWGKGADVILSQCGNKTFLLNTTPKTADWAENAFGHRATVLVERWGQKGKVSITESRGNNEPAFPAAVFMAWPDQGKTLCAISDIPNVGAVRSEIPFQELLTWTKPADPHIPDICPATNTERLWLWSEEEERLFCGDPAK